MKCSVSMLSLSTLMALSQSACAQSYQSAPSSRGTSASTADSYFNQAETASRRGEDMSSYQQMMAGGKLEMYPEYWQLNQYLDSQSPQTIINFVTRYQGSVMAEKLVADYAETKARMGDYAAVRAVANYVTNPDASEACALALGFNGTGDAMRGFTEKANVWLETQAKQPELCTQLASQLNNNPMISNTDREARLYRMIRTGNHSDIIGLASRLGVSLDYNQLSMVASNPRGFMANAASLPATATNRYLYLYGLAQIAKQSVNEAAYQLQNDSRINPMLLDAKTQRYGYRTLGVARMNVNTDIGFSVEAVDWMAKSVGEPFNFEEAEDYAQAAIRFSRWQDVATAIGAMDYKTQQQPIWQYWLAKAYSMGGNASQKSQAQSIFRSLAQKNDYYGLLAKDQIGERFNRVPATPRPTNNDYTRLSQDPHFNRAFTLYGLSASPTYTNREWNWAVRQARNRGDEAVIVAAAQTANDMGWYDRAIFAIENTKTLTNTVLAYPMPYQTSVVNYSRRVGIDPAWAYGITRQESRFNVGAKSSVGAGGLMQIMPDTAKYIAKKLGEPYIASSVASGDTNIRYGTFYMSDILNRFSGQTVLATAGYNAGPNKAKTWQPDFGSLPADQYVESIPYSETRQYVKAVMENTANYGALLGESQSITQRMGIIPPKQ